jgi:hypothetical protein
VEKWKKTYRTLLGKWVWLDQKSAFSFRQMLYKADFI